MPLYNRGSSFYAVYCLSKEEASKIGKKQIRISLHTKDRGLAEQRYFMVMSDIVKKIRLTTFKETPMPTPFTIPQELLRASLKDTKNKLRQIGYGGIYPYDKPLIELLPVEYLNDKICWIKQKIEKAVSQANCCLL